MRQGADGPLHTSWSQPWWSWLDQPHPLVWKWGPLLANLIALLACLEYRLHLYVGALQVFLLIKFLYSISWSAVGPLRARQSCEELEISPLDNRLTSWLKEISARADSIIGRWKFYNQKIHFDGRLLRSSSSFAHSQCSHFVRARSNSRIPRVAVLSTL